MQGAFSKISLDHWVEKGWLFCFTVLISKGCASAVANTDNFSTAAALPRLASPRLASSLVPKIAALCPAESSSLTVPLE